MMVGGDIILLTVHRIGPKGINDDDEELLATAHLCNCSILFIDETCDNEAFVMKR